MGHKQPTPAPNRVWIVGQYRGELVGTDLVAWDFQGVFLSQAQAESACIDQRYFVGPAFIGQTLPTRPVAWPGAYYPLHA